MKKYFSLILSFALIMALPISFSPSEVQAHTTSAVHAHSTHDCVPGKTYNSLDSTPCALIPVCQINDILNHRDGTTCPNLTPQSLNDLSLAKALGIVKIGDKNEIVEQIQQALIALGYPLTADGAFGKATLGQIKSFQKKVALTRDGVIGSRTFEALQRELNKKSAQIALLSNVNKIRVSSTVQYKQEVNKLIAEAEKTVDSRNSATWGALVVNEPDSRWYKKDIAVTSIGEPLFLVKHTHHIPNN